MAISSTVKNIIPYIKQAGNYVKLMISSKAVQMESGNDLETELKNKLKPSDWIPMSVTANLKEKLQFRKIGNVVHVKGSLQYADNGIFRNDQVIGRVPQGMEPSEAYASYSCMFSLPFCNGNGYKNRLYIKTDGSIYFAGTENATSATIAVSSYLTD